ncbi:Ribosome-binding protein 1 [Babesia bigemina]|uniref:Ribosome-binding protein 1 n=1 Tax=Babesia bigemina TaxID=5866 RepID=A0A061D9R5_BABBI|nr:Ribosome-binding protein 1 [Babesia bigemina]CDR97436.1 Ribosome-binding protein 1 [Babesia bigemina]|eukprot:XP_012769622.1 Ribosome-binding protein 1 [Babesia bigemina]
MASGKGPEFKTLKECLEFLEWLYTNKQGQPLQSSIANRLYRLIKDRYIGVNQGNIEKALSTFLSRVSNFHKKLCKNARGHYLGNKSPKDVLYALLESIPKLLSAIYFLRYKVDANFKALGGGGWTENQVGYGKRMRSPIDAYITAKANERKYGVISGGFDEIELKMGHQSGYSQGSNMVNDLRMILDKHFSGYNYFLDVFATSVFGKHGSDMSNVANALRLVQDFCGIFEKVTGEEDFKNNLQARYHCISWQDLQQHCSKLKKSLEKIFKGNRFSFTGYAREPQVLSTENIAKKMAKWFKNHLGGVIEKLNDIQAFDTKRLPLNSRLFRNTAVLPPKYPEAFTAYFTKNFIPYGFTFYHNQYKVESTPYQVLFDNWNGAIHELKNTSDGLDELLKILNGKQCASRQKVKKTEKKPMTKPDAELESDTGHENKPKPDAETGTEPETEPELEDDNELEDDLDSEIDSDEELMNQPSDEEDASINESEATKTEAAKPVVTKNEATPNQGKKAEGAQNQGKKAEGAQNQGKKAEGAQNQGKKAEGAQNQGKKAEGTTNQPGGQSDGNGSSAGTPSPGDPVPSSGQDLGGQGSASGRAQQSSQEPHTGTGDSTPIGGVNNREGPVSKDKSDEDVKREQRVRQYSERQEQRRKQAEQKMAAMLQRVTDEKKQNEEVIRKHQEADMERQRQWQQLQGSDVPLLTGILIEEPPDLVLDGEIVKNDNDARLQDQMNLLEYNNGSYENSLRVETQREIDELRRIMTRSEQLREAAEHEWKSEQQILSSYVTGKAIKNDNGISAGEFTSLFPDIGVPRVYTIKRPKAPNTSQQLHQPPAHTSPPMSKHGYQTGVGVNHKLSPISYIHPSPITANSDDIAMPGIAGVSITDTSLSSTIIDDLPISSQNDPSFQTMVGLKGNIIPNPKRRASLPPLPSLKPPDQVSNTPSKLTVNIPVDGQMIGKMLNVAGVAIKTPSSQLIGDSNLATSAIQEPKGQPIIHTILENLAPPYQTMRLTGKDVADPNIKDSRFPDIPNLISVRPAVSHSSNPTQDERDLNVPHVSGNAIEFPPDTLAAGNTPAVLADSDASVVEPMETYNPAEVPDLESKTLPETVAFDDHIMGNMTSFTGTVLTEPSKMKRKNMVSLPSPLMPYISGTTVKENYIDSPISPHSVEYLHPARPPPIDVEIVRPPAHQTNSNKLHTSTVTPKSRDLRFQLPEIIPLYRGSQSSQNSKIPDVELIPVPPPDDKLQISVQPKRENVDLTEQDIYGVDLSETFDVDVRKPAPPAIIVPDIPSQYSRALFAPDLRVEITKPSEPFQATVMDMDPFMDGSNVEVSQPTGKQNSDPTAADVYGKEQYDVDLQIHVPDRTIQDDSYDVNIDEPPPLQELQPLNPIDPATTAISLSIDPLDPPESLPNRYVDPYTHDAQSVSMCTAPWMTQAETGDSTDIPETELFPSRAPRTVRDMLQWLAGLRNEQHHNTLEKCIAKAFSGPHSDPSQLALSINHTNIRPKDVFDILQLTAMFTGSVLNSIAPKWKANVSSRTVKPKLSNQSDEPDCCALLCQLLDYVYACHHQLQFLKAQCKREKSHGGWQNYNYGNAVSPSDSPLQAFLTEGWDSAFDTHLFDPCNLCHKSRVRMGFKKEDLAKTSQQGNTLATILTPSCGGSDPLLTLCSYLNCLTRRTPRTTGELVSYFHNFGHSIYN